MKVEAAACLERLVRETKQSLAFDENNDYQSWKKQIKSKLFELLGMDSIEKNICPLNFERSPHLWVNILEPTASAEKPTAI